MKNCWQLFLVVLSFSLYTLDTSAQITSIPNASFETKLVQLGIDSDGLVNGQILNSDAAGVTTLNVSNSNISDLTGIAAFSALETLNCRNNQLAVLDIASNTTLLNLNCAGNQLTTINLSNNLLLTVLDVRGNPLGSLNVTANTALIELICLGSQLTSLDVSTNTNLETLTCTANQLTSLDVSTNTNLKVLDCGSNLLTTLNLTQNTVLEKLSCSNNQFTTLSLSTNIALSELYCSSNQISSLVLPNTNSFRRLSCTDNQLTSISLSGVPFISRLICQNNQLDSLDFSANPWLTYVNCNNSNLKKINLTNAIGMGVFYCAHNELTALNLSDCPSIREIHCENNQLTELDFSANPSLWTVDCSNNQIEDLDFSIQPDLVRLYCKNNQLRQINLLAANPLYYTSLLFDCEDNIFGLQVCVQDTAAANAVALNIWKKNTTTSYTNTCYSRAIIGRIVADNNMNCLIDSLDIPIGNQLLKIEKGNAVWYTNSNQTDGRYSAYLDTGAYTLTAIPNAPYWTACIGIQNAVIDSITDQDTVDWSLQANTFCPYLSASISAPFLRMTGGGSSYTVSYCNDGTAAADNAYIEIEMDSFLNVLGASIPIANQSGNIYTFNLDTLDVGECGSFTIDVLVDTSAVFEQTHCTEVHIYPDSLCNSPWTGPIINAKANCQVDTIYFTIKNSGTSMVQSHTYSIFEDHVMLLTSPFQLGAGGSIVVAQPTTQGKTYRIEADQAPGFPLILGGPFTHATVVGCNPLPNGNFNVGIVPQYYTGNPSPWVDVDCQQNIASYDPNDKSAQPLGYGLSHYINRNNLPIDYKVRFQNTGTDTAFNIVVVDTLSPHVDVSTLKLKTSSHPYSWQVSGNGILTVTFSNIKLVDSLANEPLSHGFFTYEIQQKANLPLGTVINNTAAIYFDYNPPIFTNTTFHTIGENFIPTILVSVDYLEQESRTIQVFPNPFDQVTTLLVSGENYEELELEIMDVTGRIVQQTQAKQTTKIQLYRNDLLQGVYFYKLKGNGKWIGSGKIIAK